MYQTCHTRSVSTKTYRSREYWRRISFILWFEIISISESTWYLKTKLTIWLDTEYFKCFGGSVKSYQWYPKLHTFKLYRYNISWSDVFLDILWHDFVVLEIMDHFQICMSCALSAWHFNLLFLYSSNQKQLSKWYAHNENIDIYHWHQANKARKFSKKRLQCIEIHKISRHYLKLDCLWIGVPNPIRKSVHKCQSINLLEIQPYSRFTDYPIIKALP